VAVVAVDTLNVRSGPGTVYSIIGKVSRNTELQILARDEAGKWIQVCCVDDKQGWVSADLVEIAGAVEAIALAAEIPPTPVPTPTPIPQPTPTPAPQPTPTPAYYYRVAYTACIHSGDTFIEGTVYEGQNRVNGVKVRLSYAPDGPPVVNDYVTGTDPSKPGMFTHILMPHAPRPGTWCVWVVDNNGNRISEVGCVTTNNLGPDDPNACWRGVVDFVH